MKYLITGSNGQLGREFTNLLSSKSADYLAGDIDTIDIADLDSLIAIVRYYKPSVVINCAAYNLVDQAEISPELAYQINSVGPVNLAIAAEEVGAVFVHYGTDYVFDGRKGAPYAESDTTNPLNQYGESKLLGEQKILQIARQTGNPSLIFRVSWVYGSGAQNFIHKLLGWADASPELNIADDEISVPTSTSTIALTTLSAIDRGLSGLWHLTNGGYCSRYEWAEFILHSLGKSNILNRASKEDFKLPAKRPGFSAMSNSALSKILDIDVPLWKEALADYLSKSFA